MTRRLALLILAMSTSALAADMHQNIPPRRQVIAGPIVGWVDKVVDGDTLAVTAMPWPGLRMQTLVRIDGIDAPELRGKCPFEKRRAQQAKTYLGHLVGNRSVILRNVKLGKYAGRVVAQVETVAGGNVGTMLLERNLARPYDAGPRQSWCVGL